MGMTVENFTIATIYALFCEHIMAYLFDIFRSYDIKKNGRTNRFGIEHAPKETLLRILEVLIDLFIAIVLILHFKNLDDA